MFASLKARVLLLLAALAVTPQPAPATPQGTGYGFLQPSTYVSASGACELYVDPSSWHGRGTATYTLRRDGKLVWSREKQFALWNAALSDSGVTLGYAYSQGPDGGRDQDEFRVVLIAPDGSLLREEVVKRVHGGMMHSPPKPSAQGLFLHEGLGLGIVRLTVLETDPETGSEKNTWWVYDLANGKKLESFDPTLAASAPYSIARIVQATPLPDTSLTLLHWSRIDFEGRGHKYGVCFSLLDADWDQVWELDLPLDYTTDGDRKTRIELEYEAEAEGPILGVSAGGRFELRLAAEGKRVTFVAEQIGGKWDVHEVARQAFIKPEIPASKWNELQPKLIASIPLGVNNNQTSEPIRDIVEFTVDEGGVLRFIRKEQEPGHYTIVRLAADGAVTSEVAVEPVDGEQYE